MRLALAPCGSWPASEGGLRADQPPTARTQSTVGASLLAKAASQPTHLQQPAPNPTVGAGLPAIAISQPTNLQQPTPNPTVGAGLLAKAAFQTTHLQQPTPNPTVGAGLPATATSQPPSFFQVYSMPMSATLTDQHRAAANRATGCCRAVVVFHSVAQGVGWRGTESVDPGRCRGS